MFFILGSPRSGTSMLRMMLNSHSKMTVPPECGFALWLYDKYGSCNFINNSILAESFIEDLLKTRKIETWRLTKSDLLRKVELSKPESYQDICACVYSCYGENAGKVNQIFGDKNNYYISELDLLKQVFPKSKYICIVRDGRDVACSYNELNGKTIISLYAPKLPKSIIDIASDWDRNNRIVFDEIKNGALLVRYEDLVQDPQSQLTRVCNYLGLEYEVSMLDFYKLKGSAEPDEFLQWKEKTAHSVSKDSIKRYLNELSKEEILQFESEAFFSLAKFGYLQ